MKLTNFMNLSTNYEILKRFIVKVARFFSMIFKNLYFLENFQKSDNKGSFLYYHF